LRIGRLFFRDQRLEFGLDSRVVKQRPGERPALEDIQADHVADHMGVQVVMGEIGAQDGRHLLRAQLRDGHVGDVCGQCRPGQRLAQRHAGEVLRRDDAQFITDDCPQPARDVQRQHLCQAVVVQRLKRSANVRPGGLAQRRQDFRL